MLMTMLRGIREVYGYTICTVDFHTGHIQEAYLDDREWVVRRFAVKISDGSSAHEIHLPSRILVETDPERKVFFIQMSSEDLRKGLPDLSEDEKCLSLKPTRQIIGTKVYAKDSEVGEVEDLILNDANFAVRYLVVDAGVINKKFIISPWWVEKVFWETGGIFLRVGIEEVFQSPEYNFTTPMIQGYENELHEYYKKQSYWA